MTAIKKLADQMAEELESAKDYAEDFLTFKAKGNQTQATRYKEMATDEIKRVYP